MKIEIIKDKEGVISVLDEHGKLLKKFRFNDNLQKNLHLLRQVNSLKTEEGVPIFKTRMINGISVWSFFQSSLFWNLLWNSTKYEELKRFIFKNKIKKVIIRQKGLRLENYLRMSGIKVCSNFNWRSPIKIFLAFFIRFIAWIISYLAILKIIIFKRSFLIYTPDKFSKKYGCDFRFYHTYHYLKEKNIKFSEVFHTLLGKEFIKNLWLRKRLALYLESFPLFFIKRKKSSHVYDLSIFESYEHQYLSNVLERVDGKAVKSIKRIKILSRLLKLTKIKTLLSIDDTRSANELIAACKISGIKTYGFQHGQFSKYHVGWINYDMPKEISASFDKLFIWNDYAQELLLDYSTAYNKNNTAPVGGIKEPPIMEYRKRELKLPLRVLVPYESFAPKREVGIFLEKLLDFGCELYFKPRPDVSVDFQFKEYYLQKFNNIKIIKDIDADALAKIDAVVATYTGFLMEMIFYEKPILIFDTFFDFGHRYVEDNLAMLIKKDTKLKEIIDYIRNHESKKEIAWPKTETTLEKVLDKILK